MLYASESYTELLHGQGAELVVRGFFKCVESSLPRCRPGMYEPVDRQLWFHDVNGTTKHDAAAGSLLSVWCVGAFRLTKQNKPSDREQTLQDWPKCWSECVY